MAVWTSVGKSYCLNTFEMKLEIRKGKIHDFKDTKTEVNMLGYVIMGPWAQSLK